MIEAYTSPTTTQKENNRMSEEFSGRGRNGSPWRFTPGLPVWVKKAGEWVMGYVRGFVVRGNQVRVIVDVNGKEERRKPRKLFPFLDKGANASRGR